MLLSSPPQRQLSLRRYWHSQLLHLLKTHNIFARRWKVNLVTRKKDRLRKLPQKTHQLEYLVARPISRLAPYTHHPQTLINLNPSNTESAELLRKSNRNLFQVSICTTRD